MTTNGLPAAVWKILPEQYWSYLYPFLDGEASWKLAKICTKRDSSCRLVDLSETWMEILVCSCTFDLSFADDLLGLMFPLARSLCSSWNRPVNVSPLARSKFKGLSQTSSLWLEINGLAFCRELLSWIIFPSPYSLFQYSYGKVRKTKVDFFERHENMPSERLCWIWHKENILSDFRE